MFFSQSEKNKGDVSFPGSRKKREWKGLSRLIVFDKTQQRSHLIVFIDIVFIIIFVGFVYPLARSAISSTHIKEYNAVIKKVTKKSGNLLIVKLKPTAEAEVKPTGLFDYLILNGDGEEVLSGSDTLPGENQHRLITYSLNPGEENGVYRCTITIGEDSGDMVLDLSRIKKRKRFQPLKVFREMIEKDSNNKDS